uniref:Uncharacterized protein n=1 Tax=Arundo donax TaxID=35708 RepID=A0A0A8Y6L6_ARUDO
MTNILLVFRPHCTKSPYKLQLQLEVWSKERISISRVDEEYILIYQMNTPNSTQVLQISSYPANKTSKSERKITNSSSAFCIIINQVIL